VNKGYLYKPYQQNNRDELYCLNTKDSVMINFVFVDSSKMENNFKINFIFCTYKISPYQNYPSRFYGRHFNSFDAFMSFKTL